MDRDATEAMVRRLYAMREVGDVDGMLDCFAPDGSWRIAGDAQSCAIARRHSAAELREALEAVCATFQALAFRPTTVLVDGNRVMATVDARLVFSPTGETVETEIVHVWTLADGKVTEIVEYLDTAHVTRLMACLPVTPPA